MAKSNVIRVSLLGDAKDLTTAVDKAEDGLRDLDTQADKTGDGLGTVGDRADASEQRIMGLRDMVDGTAAIMKGPGADGISAYLQGWADMASGVVNFVVPSLQMIKTGLITNIKAGIAGAKAAVASAAKQVAAWVLLGAQALLHAAKVAAAWLISMGPIALVIAAVVGLVVLIVKNWDKIKQVIAAGWNWVKEKTKALVDFLLQLFLNFTPIGIVIKNFDKVIAFFKALPSKIAAATSGMWNGIKDAFRSAINWMIDKWNNFKITLGGFQLPAWMGGGTAPSFTINTPNIPRLHGGGLFHSPQGEGLAILRNGERVLPPGQSRQVSAPPVILKLMTVGGREVVELLQQYERLYGPVPVSVRV